MHTWKETYERVKRDVRTCEKRHRCVFIYLCLFSHISYIYVSFHIFGCAVAAQVRRICLKRHVCVQTDLYQVQIYEKWPTYMKRDLWKRPYWPVAAQVRRMCLKRHVCVQTDLFHVKWNMQIYEKWPTYMKRDLWKRPYWPFAAQVRQICSKRLICVKQTYFTWHETYL